MFCDGTGDQRADPQKSGCCELPGDGRGICPLRWFVDPSGVVYNSVGGVVGPDLDQAIRTRYGINNRNARAQAVEALGWQPGVQMVLCTAMGQTYVDHWAEFMSQTGGVWSVTDVDLYNQRRREEFDAGGTAQAVGDVWVAEGMDRYWCTTYGPTEEGGQCCFRPDHTPAAITTTAVTIRRAAPGAS